MHPTVRLEDLSQFFQQHLIRDLEMLSKAVGYSIDDTALIVHLILKGMYKHAYTGKLFYVLFIACHCFIVEPNLNLLTKESRRKWEQHFYAVYIKHVLDDRDSQLQTVQELITNDDRQGMDAFKFMNSLKYKHD